MLEKFVEKANTWEYGPNEVTLPGFVLAMVSFVVLMCCALPGYNMWSVILPSIIVPLWAIVIGIVTLHPAKDRLMRERRLGVCQSDALRNYRRLPDEVKAQLPTLTLDDLEQMSGTEADQVDHSMRDLHKAYQAQQKLLRTPRHTQFIETAKDLERTIIDTNQHMKELV